MDNLELIERLAVGETAELWLVRLPKAETTAWMVRLDGQSGAQLPSLPSVGILAGLSGLDGHQVAVCDAIDDDGRFDVLLQVRDGHGNPVPPPDPGDELPAGRILTELVKALSTSTQADQGGHTRPLGVTDAGAEATRMQPQKDVPEETVMAPSGLHEEPAGPETEPDQDRTRAFPSGRTPRDADSDAESPQPDKTEVWESDDATEVASFGTQPFRGTERIDELSDTTEQFESTEQFEATKQVGKSPGHAVGDTPLGGRAGESGDDIGLSVGSVLRNRFRITGVLGEGGMGTVFSAVDMLKEEAKDEEVDVALKIMKADIVDEDMSFMGLQREARRAQQLAHPNIVTVYDFDRAEGVIYMTMEFMRGQPLDEVLKKNPHGLDLEAARDITTQISNGLAYAHKERIVHSDLKPQNVFVLDSGRAKILDFGIARAYQAKKVDVVESVFSGYSPAFASPEVMARKSPSPADDVFALGCVVYMLFTGRHPFDWTSAEEAAEQGLKPKRDSSFKRAEWSAVSAALKFDRAKRPQDAAEFLKRFAPSRVRQVAIAVSLASIIATGAFIFFYEPVPGPDTPFEELPVEVQQVITRNLDDAAMFLEYGDLDSTFQLYDAVLSAHPGNLDAIEGMQKASEEAVKTISSAVDRGQISPAAGRQALDSLLAYETMPSRIRRQLQNARERL